MFQKKIALYQKILYIRLHPAFMNYPPEALNRLSPTNLGKRILKILLYTGGRLLPNVFKPEPPTNHLKGKTWLYVLSQNNVEALHFLKDKLPQTEFVAGQNKQIGRYANQVSRLSLRWKFVYSFQFLPVFLGLYKNHGRQALRFFDLIFVSLGFYEAYVRHLKNLKPRCIIFTNDHNDDARAMLFAAKNLKIPTFYIQHATVSTMFPPLEFDLNLLEGEDALQKYRECGPVTGKVKLVGMPKADAFLRYRNFKRTVESIGICSNRLDDYLALKETITGLSKKLPDVTLIFRPHPNDYRDYSFINQLPNAKISDPKSEKAFEFLSQTDTVIAGESSILLEAVLLNIPGIYFKFGKSKFQHDYYGYVKNGLVQEAKNQNALLEIISQLIVEKPEVYQKANFYNATVGTQWEGKSNELVINYVQEFLANHA